MSEAPALTQESDAVRGWWQRLGLPGLIDVHVHFMPKPVMDAVWRYFDSAPAHYGTDWPIWYRTDEAVRIATLREFGVRRFSSLLYPHKPGMARGLNEWAAGFAAAVPDCLHSATFFPEESAAGYVAAALDGGARIFKAHVQVGGYDPRDPWLRPVWGQLADAGVPVVVHCGSGPLAGRHTGPGPIGEVLAQHPRLTAVIAHAGAPEFAEHLDFARRYDNVHLDTTMVGTPLMDLSAPFPPALLPELAELRDKVLLGTDFPNIPHPYLDQLQALEAFGLGQDWLRAVCWGNAARLFGLPPQ